MKIGYLGSGAWGYCLAHLLASNGHDVTLWGIEHDVLDHIEEKGEHPKYPGFATPKTLRVTKEAAEAIDGAELIVESVTTKGIRPVLRDLGPFKVPFVITSKGIEQNTGLLVPEIALAILGDAYKDQIVCLSGPTIAEEVMNRMPTTIVAAAYSEAILSPVVEAFTNESFRVYPNRDVLGVAFGGAMKNIIAIASGICDGLGFGHNTKAAMITRGLHEMRKLAPSKSAEETTLNGLSGLGDLCVTCLSPLSRNYKFGLMIADGATPEVAKERIGMVVEGANTCISALQLAKKEGIALPIAEAVHAVLYEEIDPREAVKALLTRPIKQEWL